MSFQTLITPAPEPPLQARQTYNPTDPGALSSLEAYLSSYLLQSYSYSAYSYDPNYYSSLLAAISTEYPQVSISIPTYSYSYYYSTPGILVTTKPTTAATATAGTAKSNNSGGGGGGGGLSTGAKIWIGVGVVLGVGLLVGIGIFLWCAGKRKGKKKGTTIVQPPPMHQHQQPQQQQIYMPNQQGYMQGYQQPAPSPYPQSQPQNIDVYGKTPAFELAHEYHFARPGVVEMGDGIMDAVEIGKEDGKKIKKKKKGKE